MPKVWINDEFIDEETASVSLRDTGLLHAAGVFTTMRSYGGTVFQLPRHLERIRQSCDALFIPLQYKDDKLSKAIAQLLKKNNIKDARLRMTVTRGAAKQDPLHGLHLTPNCFITASALDPYPREYYEKGLTVSVIDEQKLNPYDLQAGHKTVNYFSRLAALRNANMKGAGEAIWFDVHNYLQSGSISNIFIYKNGHLMTPPTNSEVARDPKTAKLKSCVLPGVTRLTVIELANTLDIPCAAALLTINELLDADEVFLTNSIMGIMPVVRVERKAIGLEKPGPITMQLSEVFAKKVLEV